MTDQPPTVRLDGFEVVENDPRIEVDGPEEIPEFASEDEEAEFWRTHTFSEAFWDQMPPVPDELLPPIDRSRLPQARRA